MRGRAFLPVLAVVALLVAALGLGAVTPASATPKPIGLSLDGVTFSDSLPASLFAGALIVPGGSIQRSFYVENRASGPGNLAVALQGVSGIDSVMISSLSVSAAAGSQGGSPIGFPAAKPCHSLMAGVGLAPGGVVRVDVTLKLGPTPSGHTAQNSVGSFDLRVSLTSTDVPAPTGCTAVTPPAGGGGGSGGGGGGHPSTPGEIDSTVISGAADGNLPETGGDLSGVSGSGTGFANPIILPNTGRLYQEYDVLGWLALMILGGIFAWWRRSRDPEDEDA